MILEPTSMVTIKLARSPREIEHCYPVFSQLHPHIHADGFVDAVHHQNKQTGYELVYLAEDNIVKSVAGFHVGQSFGWQKYLYVADLVTDEASRSNGYGKKVMDWLICYGREHQCEQLHLDSRVVRYSAHKFYLNQGMIIAGYHFVMEL